MPLSEAVRNTLAFLKMAAIELRRIAAQPSDITNDVLRVAEKLEDEAADMERRDSIAVATLGEAVASSSG